MSNEFNSPKQHIIPVPSQTGKLIGDRYPFQIISDDFAMGFEIGQHSELSGIGILTRSGSTIYPAVGAPAIGPFQGPFGLFLVNGQGIPGPVATNFMTSLPPLLHLIQHIDRCYLPSIGGVKRAVAHRSFPSKAVAVGYANYAEIPVWGRQRVGINIAASISAAYDIRLLGATYHVIDNVAGVAVERDPNNFSTTGDVFAGTVRTTLISDTLAIPAATTDTKLEVVNNTWHTIIVQVKSAAGAGNAFVLSQAHD